MAKIAPDLPLHQLAAIANNEHRLSIETSRDALQHGIRCGNALLQARDRIGLADWAQWVDQNVAVSPTTVQRYMRLAMYEAEVRTSEATSISEAIEAVKGLPPTGDANDLRRASTETVDKARQLRADGAGVKEIATELGVHRESVSKWTDPQAHANSIARHERRRDHRRKDVLDRKANNYDQITAPLPADVASKYRREGIADACVLLVAKRIIPTMNLSDWGDVFGLDYGELAAAVGRLKDRATAKS